MGRLREVEFLRGLEGTMAQACRADRALLAFGLPCHIRQLVGTFQAAVRLDQNRTSPTVNDARQVGTALLHILSEAATLANEAPKLEEYYFPILFGLGSMILLIAWLPVVLKKLPLSLPIVCVLIGFIVFSVTPLSGWAPHPDKTPKLVERAAELIVIVSLMGGGLKIERAIAWQSWNVTWRLLGIAMPLTILMVMLLGHQLLGLGLATALLLAGSLAPTDPVLAGDVQIEHDEDEEEAEAKFALTSEAGLNDALAFPFIHLAIAIAAAGSLTGAVLGDWVLNDVLWKLGAGLVVGAGLSD
jgi:NhaP-type Na+/H+ or K+/H+ antiporter